MCERETRRSVRWFLHNIIIISVVWCVSSSSSTSWSSSVAVTLPQSALPGRLQYIWDVTMSYLLMLTGCLSLWCPCVTICVDKPEEVYLWLIIVTHFSNVSCFSYICHHLSSFNCFLFSVFSHVHSSPTVFSFLNFISFFLSFAFLFPLFTCNFLSFMFFSFLSCPFFLFFFSFPVFSFFSFLFCPVLSFLFLFLFLSFLSCIFFSSFLSYPVFYFIVFPFLSCFSFLSFPLLSFPFLSYLLLSFPFLSFPFLSSPLLSFPFLSFPSSPLLSFCWWLTFPAVVGKKGEWSAGWGEGSSQSGNAFWLADGASTGWTKTLLSEGGSVCVAAVVRQDRNSSDCSPLSTVTLTETLQPWRDPPGKLLLYNRQSIIDRVSVRLRAERIYW